jgi:hypothetical protein
MMLDDLKATILASRSDDWERLLIGPFYDERHEQVSDARGTHVEVEKHHTLAVFRDDIRLRLAFGIVLDRDLDFGWGFPDPKVKRDL